MDIYQILTLIVTLLGSVIAGLFTFLGVKKTIDNNNKIYLREKEESDIANKASLKIIEYEEGPYLDFRNDMSKVDRFNSIEVIHLSDRDCAKK